MRITRKKIPSKNIKVWEKIDKSIFTFQIGAISGFFNLYKQKWNTWYISPRSMTMSSFITIDLKLAKWERLQWFFGIFFLNWRQNCPTLMKQYEKSLMIIFNGQLILHHVFQTWAPKGLHYKVMPPQRWQKWQKSGKIPNSLQILYLPNLHTYCLTETTTPHQLPDIYLVHQKNRPQSV